MTIPTAWLGVSVGALSGGSLLQAAGFDAKKGWNCSYPGAHAVTANPVEWAEKITRQNRQEWIGPQLTSC